MPRATWGLRELLLSIPVVAFAYVIASVALLLPALAAWGDDSDNFRFVTGLMTVVLDSLAAAGVIVLVYRSGGTLTTLGFRAPVVPDEPRTLSQMLATRGGGMPWGYVAKLAFGAVFAGMVFLQAYGLALRALGLEDLLPNAQFPEAYFENTAVVAMLGVGVLAAAPVVEELVLRGFVFAGLRRYWGFAPAALLSGFVFSLLHLQIGLILPFTFIGAMFAYLYYRSGSLIPAIAAHFLFNAFSFAVLILVPEARS